MRRQKVELPRWRHCVRWADRDLGEALGLGLARACAFQGETAKARAAYQDFLTLWKDAGIEIPILKQAKTEYAKLE